MRPETAAAWLWASYVEILALKVAVVVMAVVVAAIVLIVVTAIVVVAVAAVAVVVLAVAALVLLLIIIFIHWDNASIRWDTSIRSDNGRRALPCGATTEDGGNFDVR